MDIEAILFWRLPQNSIKSQVNGMREELQDRRRVLFCCDLWLTAGFLLVKRVFGFDGGLFLVFGEREVEGGLVEVECGEGFFELLYFCFEL